MGTPKGSAGSIYTKPTTKIHVTQQALPLEKYPTGGEVVRQVEKDELVEIVMPPKEQKCEPLQVAHIRAVGDKKEGWISVANDFVNPCIPYFLCNDKEVKFYVDKTSESEEVGTILKGEIVEPIDGPIEGPGEVAWIKLQAEKDGRVGWAPLRSAEKEVLF